MAEEFALADQLKSEFRGRGADVSGMRASSTPELMRRAEMGRDPRVNVAEEAFRENYRARQNVQGTAPSRPPRTAAPRAGMNPQGSPNGGYRPSSAASRPPRTAGMGNAPRTAPARDTLSEEIAGRGRARQRAAQGERNRTAEPAASRGTGAKKNRLRVEQTRAAKKRAAAAAGNRTEEIEVQRGAFPVAIVALTLIAVLIIFSIVESLAQVYQTSSEIARMKAELEALKETAAGMELKLDEKNDIRNIRSIAVGELGMAEEDSMQRRFVSVSGGERIEILEAEGDDSAQAGGVLFSSLGKSVSRFFDRFR